MSKAKALAYAATLILIGCLFLPIQLYGCFWPFLVSGLFYGAIAYYKHHRDMRIIKRAEQEQSLVSSQLPALPPMSSQGSSRLFVPPPLQQRNYRS